MFTTGSTGRPKAVAVSQAAAASYLDYAQRRYRPAPADRFSQVFDLTFDLSVHDLFLAWRSGAACYALPQLSPADTAAFIAEHRLTMWFATPSLAMLMAQAGALEPGALPSLRWSLFCGEALPEQTATQWQAAADGSILENLYGPTEATIAISHHRWDPAESPRRCLHGVVPLGRVFRGQHWRVAGPGLTQAVPGSRGELLLAGSQVARGYLDDPDQTAESFLSLDGEPGLTWYRTGDVVQADPDGVLHFLGRTDSQVQVQGQRVELQEVDQALRQAAGSDLAVAVARPHRAAVVEAIYGFVAGGSAEAEPAARREAAILERLRQSLPDHMIPARVFFLPGLPRNANGKLDRAALARRLEELAGPA
jgi:non-ribosomal peptide synthetase component F